MTRKKGNRRKVQGAGHKVKVKVFRGLKFQIPNSKPQTSTKFQLPNDPNKEDSLQGAFVWKLEFGIWDLFGIWCL
jgi:hypothetical protein